jgi:hypothetical protein
MHFAKPVFIDNNYGSARSFIANIFYAESNSCLNFNSFHVITKDIRKKRTGNLKIPGFSFYRHTFSVQKFLNSMHSGRQFEITMSLNMHA